MGTIYAKSLERERKLEAENAELKAELASMKHVAESWHEKWLANSRELAALRSASEPVGEIRNIAANKAVHEIRHAHFSKGCLPPVGTKLYTEPQPAQSEHVADEVRYLSKWLNEGITAPIDRVALATVLNSIKQPAQSDAKDACDHQWVRDQEAITYHCCQKCGAIKRDQAMGEEK